MYTYKKYKSTDKEIYESSLELRNDLLRIPFGKSIYDDNLEIEKDNDFYGVFKNNELIGTFSCFEEAPYNARLTAFAIKSNFQGKGLGKGLVKFSVSDLKRRKYINISCYALSTAKDFYQKCGFLVVEEPVLNENLGVYNYKMDYKLV